MEVCTIGFAVQRGSARGKPSGPAQAGLSARMDRVISGLMALHLNDWHCRLGHETSMGESIVNQVNG
jgi:hypothetical protein